eukprot:TRINITY_DN10298_c0_g2_i1.p1 TRINITY_DN10298_c0_g2~~TRINITY_DN10298_c0_g2_i1.p1  ORF type:complete len:444 (+),score=106.90 TRINITY_DN10298_c0_g2_i1:132-1463(+)
MADQGTPHIPLPDGKPQSYVEDGVTMEWDFSKGAYFPKLDDTFVVTYQQAYPGASSGSDWTTYTNEQGVPYYYNSKTNVTTWERPKELDQQKTAVAPAAGGSMPTQGTGSWVTYQDEQGRPYYYNTQTQQTSWVLPAELQAPATANTQASKSSDSKEPTADDKQSGKRKRSRKDQAAKDKVKVEDGAVKLSKKVNCHVYVTGLPLDITLEEFTSFMAKAGIINEDDEGNKRIRLYLDEEGQPKGDGKCTYLRVESVDLALTILDGAEIKPGYKVSIQRAVFKMKEGMTLGKQEEQDGEAADKKAKLKKKSLGQKKLHWHETDTKRKRALGVLVLKHMFTPEQIKADPSYIFELKSDIERECLKFGAVKKVEVFDGNPEGVIMVRYFDDESLGPAIATLNGRWFDQRQIVAEEWDGKTKYKVKESKEEEEARIAQWDEYLNSEE